MIARRWAWAVWCAERLQGWFWSVQDSEALWLPALGRRIAQTLESDQPASEDSNSDMPEPRRRVPWLGDARRVPSLGCGGNDQFSLDEKIIL